jgi:hypothetical protein
VQAGVPAAAIWAEPRGLFFFRTARVSGPEGDLACEVLAITESGAVLRSAEPWADLDRCTLELNSAHRLDGSINWIEEDRAGLRFDDREQVRAILSRRELSHPYRAPRLGLNCELEIRLGSNCLRTQCHDISEGGVKVELELEDCEGQEAIITLDGLDPVNGRVMWSSRGRAGISFEHPIAAGEFTRWVTPRLNAMAD